MRLLAVSYFVVLGPLYTEASNGIRNSGSLVRYPFRISWKLSSRYKDQYTTTDTKSMKQIYRKEYPGSKISTETLHAWADNVPLQVG